LDKNYKKITTYSQHLKIAQKAMNNEYLLKV